MNDRQESQVSSTDAHPQGDASDPLGDLIHRRRSLVDEFQLVLDHAAGGAITVRAATDVLRERGPALVMTLMMLPFLFPVPLWGLSTPAGLAIALYGMAVMMQRTPHVPGFLGRRTLSFAMLEKLVGFGTRWGRRLEKVLKPRLKFMVWPMIDVLIGAGLTFCGLFLALPLPIPFTNSIPAVAIILLLLGTIERDGVFVIAGQIVALAILALTVYVGHLLWVHGIEHGMKVLEHTFGR